MTPSWSAFHTNSSRGRLRRITALTSHRYSSHGRVQLRWSYPPLDIDNSDGQFPLLAPAVCPYVSACRFDRLGSLLACASSNGRLAVLDMDVALAQPLRQPARPVRAEAIRSYNLPKSTRQHTLPVHCVSPPQAHSFDRSLLCLSCPSFRVDCLRWQPASDDCIVVSSGQSADILQFDLNHSSNQPTSRSTLPATTTRHLSTAASSIADFTFLPSYPQLLIAATGEGALQWWDMRAGRIRNPAVAHPKAARLPCGLSASPTLPLVYVWRADASVDMYDARRLPADRRREVHAWRLAEGGLSRVKAIEPDTHDEGRFILETEGGGVSVFDMWRGSCVTVEGKQRWTGDMTVLGGRRRRIAWMNGLGAASGGRLQRGCTRVIAHATGGPEVKFSRVPLHSRGHSTAPTPCTGAGERAEDDECPSIDDDDIEWSDGDDDRDSAPSLGDDTQRIQPTIHAYFQPVHTQSPPPQRTTPQPQHKQHINTASRACACCSHVVGRVCVGGGGVSVLESHPTLDVLVCGLLNNELALVGASGVVDEDEERMENVAFMNSLDDR